MTLSESTRNYYRSTWGFDPVADCHTLRNGNFRYEECFPLLQDLPLQTVGIKICARVEWKGEAIRNRIVFRRTDDNGRRRKASVECTHTVVYAGPVADALAFVDDLNASPDGQNPVDEELSDDTRGPAILPPWEHFAALKSYVAGIADMGILTLLRQYIMPNSNPSDDLPFGFNTGMHVQVEKALFAIAPQAMLSIYRDFTRELLDTHTPAELGELRIYWPTSYTSTSNYTHWKYLLRHLDAPTLVYWFRHTGIADEFQNHLFTHPVLLAKAQAIAPDLPWDSLRLEWEARREAELLEWVTLDNGSPHMKSIPPAEVWARTPFCDYTFPRDILSPDSASARRSRVQAYLHEMVETYTERDPTEALGDLFLNGAQRVSADLDDILAAPFPTNRVRPEPTRQGLARA